MVASLTKLKVALAFFSLSVLTGIAAGQSVRHVVVIGAAGEISAPVNAYDMAATVAHLFGLKSPECWIAKPLLSAFKSNAGR